MKINMRDKDVPFMLWHIELICALNRLSSLYLLTGPSYNFYQREKEYRVLI